MQFCEGVGHAVEPERAQSVVDGMIEYGWLDREAEIVVNSENVVRGFVEECRRRMIILPSSATIERCCADALVAAERRIDTRIAARLDSTMRMRLKGSVADRGEAHHALKNALRIGRQGEIRDRSIESQHFRIAGLNLGAGIIIYRNTKRRGATIERRRRDGLDRPATLLAYISPLGWAHILLTGEYRWRLAEHKSP